MKCCLNTSYLFILCHYAYEVFMKCYEVLRYLFMYITYCFCVTYDENMKCWGVYSCFPFCTCSQKKSSLFTRVFYLTDYLQIISVKSLRNSSHLFTGLHHKIKL